MYLFVPLVVKRTKLVPNKIKIKKLARGKVAGNSLYNIDKEVLRRSCGVRKSDGVSWYALKYTHNIPEHSEKVIF